MTSPAPDPTTMRKRRFGRTILACQFLGWVVGLVLGRVFGDVGMGLSIGIGAGPLLGLLIAGVVGDLRRPRR